MKIFLNARNASLSVKICFHGFGHSNQKQVLINLGRTRLHFLLMRKIILQGSSQHCCLQHEYGHFKVSDTIQIGKIEKTCYELAQISISGKKRNLQILERLAQIELVPLLTLLSIQTVICCDASLRMHLQLQRLFFFLHNVVFFPEADGYDITVPYPHAWSRNK